MECAVLLFRRRSKGRWEGSKIEKDRQTERGEEIIWQALDTGICNCLPELNG